MLPMLLALSAVHLAMPLWEAQHAGHRAGWLGRIDQAYGWALPLTALVLAFQLSSGHTQAAFATACLAGVWVLVAAVAQFLRQPSARYVWQAGAMLALALAIYLHAWNLPWFLLGMALACTAYVGAPRLPLSPAHQEWLSLSMLLLATGHIAQSAFTPSPASLWRTSAESLFVASALLAASLIGQRRGNRFVDPMGWVGGVWGMLTLVNVLLDLHLQHWSSILFIAALVGSGALFALRHQKVHRAAPAVMAVWLTVSSQSAATEMALPWNALMVFCTPLAMGLLALTAATHNHGRDHTESKDSGIAGVVLLLLPLALWPWAQTSGQQLNWRETAFGWSVLMNGVFISSILAQWLLPRDSRWHRHLAPAMFYLVAATLALHCTFQIERGMWAVFFEVQALAYLALRVRWAAQEDSDETTLRHHILGGVVLVALFVQAQALRLWGPQVDVLTILDLPNMVSPVLLSLLWAILGAILAIGGHHWKERPLWAAGAGLLVLAAGKIVLLDSGTLGSLNNILAVLAAGLALLAVSWWAPFPPPHPSPTSQRKSVRTAASASAPVSAEVPWAAATNGPGWANTEPNAEPAHQAPPPQRQHRTTSGASRSADTLLAPPSPSLWGWKLTLVAIVLVGAGYKAFHKSQRLATPPQATTTAPNTVRQFPHGTTAQDMLMLEPPVATTKTQAPKIEPAQDPCTFAQLHLPDGAEILAAGGYQGRSTSFQIDQSNDPATVFDVIVNKTTRPVALMLGAYSPSIWRLQWTEGTQILAVLVSGYSKQIITGLPASVPVINSSRGSACPHFYYVTEDQKSALNPVAKKVFGRAVDLIHYSDSAGALRIGDPLTSASRIVSTTRQEPDSFRLPGTPLAGKDGLAEAVANGQIRLASAADWDAWAVYEGWMKDLPPVAGQGRPRAKRPEDYQAAYVVLKAFTYPAGLTGAHSVTFLIPEGAPSPQGNPGHSRILRYRAIQ